MTTRCLRVLGGRPFVRTFATRYSALALKSYIRPFATGNYTDVTKLFGRVHTLHKTVLAPLNDRLMGPLEKSSDQLIPLPMVFVLGNHSSGKSSFINFVAGRRIQETGVAPTDDGFTIISAGTADSDQDGPALVGDPKLGFAGLRQFGSNLVSHLALKVRTGLRVRDMILVDSPGMIDSPVTSSGAATNSRDRGYDFEACVKWFAEKADVILLFQDPGKPGTTGETMSVMTTALIGQGHKTHIILNKADTLRTVHDFARAYGALCWNLSKVINRKDLPRIYSMMVPWREHSGEAIPANTSNAASESSFLKEAMPDLERTRDEIVAEVHRAPARRVDNVTTHLHDSALLLRMHAVVLNAVRREYNGEIIKHAAVTAAAALSLAGLSGAAFTAGVPTVAAPLGVAALLVASAGYWYTGRVGAAKTLFFLDGPGLDEAFRRTHYIQVATKDESVIQVWERVRGPLRIALRTLGIASVPTARRSELSALETIINKDIPELRAAATRAGTLLGAETVSSAPAMAAKATGPAV